LGYFVFGCLIFCALCTFWIFICWTAGEDFLPSSGLSLDSGNCFLWCAEFLIWCSSICPFLLLFPGQLESYSENNYLRLCLPDFSHSNFRVSGLSLRALMHLGLSFVQGDRSTFSLLHVDNQALGHQVTCWPLPLLHG
jgi:hypothetical protein